MWFIKYTEIIYLSVVFFGRLSATCCGFIGGLSSNFARVCWLACQRSASGRRDASRLYIGKN
jgi:hypothetical protein